MKRILPKQDTDPRARRVFRARVDCTWLNGELESSEVIVDEFAIVGRRRGLVVLDRESTIANGQRAVDEALIAAEFDTTIGEAIRRLYRKFLARIEAAFTNEDVLSGRISEQAAVLNGLI